jgi:hypothetical protein
MLSVNIRSSYLTGGSKMASMTRDEFLDCVGQSGELFDDSIGVAQWIFDNVLEAKGEYLVLKGKNLTAADQAAIRAGELLAEQQAAVLRTEQVMKNAREEALREERQ